MIPHRQVLSKQIMLHCHTISYHCASIIADHSNTGQRKNNIFYLLSSLQRQHHHSTFLTTTDPSLHDGLSRLLGKSFRRSFGSAAGSSAAVEASAASAVALRRRPARPARSRCGEGQRGQRGQRGRAACRSAGRSLQPLPQRAGPQGCKTESVMIGMNALIDLEYAAGTLSVECTDEPSMYSVQTAFKLYVQTHF